MMQDKRIPALILIVCLAAVHLSGQTPLLPLDSLLKTGNRLTVATNNLAAFETVKLVAGDYRTTRTLGQVKGPHPYALMIDDITAEEGRRLYTWHIPLPDYADIYKMDWLRHLPEVKADIILYDTRDMITRSNGDRMLKKEAELTLIRVLECPLADAHQTYANRLHKPVTPGAVETWPADNAYGRSRRLVVPCASPTPALKLLFFRFRQGEPLPRTRWFRHGKKLVVEWHDQRDIFLFTKGNDGVTRFLLEGSHGRGPYLAFGVPAPEAGGAKGNLIGHWSFDTVTDGTARNLAGNDNDAVITGYQSIAGVQKKALRMDGSGRIEINHRLTHRMANGGTVAFWWRPQGPHTPNARIFSAKVHLRQGFDLNNYAGGIRLSGAGDYSLGYSGRNMSRKWRQLAATFDNNDRIAAFYINGKLQNEKEIQRTIDLSNNKALDVLRDYKGDFDELRVYDYALTGSDVAALYAREKCYEVAHWTFDEIVNGHELRSAAGYTGVADKAALAPGLQGKALSLAGGKAILPASVLNENFNGDITISLWFKADKTTITGNSNLFNFNEHLRNGLQCGFYAHGVRFSGAGDYHLGFSRDLKPGEWNHLVCMFDGLNANMFVNGRQVAAKKVFGQFSLTREITIGDDRGRFPGMIDEVRIFSYSLSPEEVTTIYKQR